MAYTQVQTQPCELRSVGIAYILWAVTLLGVAGLHRFYTGRYRNRPALAIHIRTLWCRVSN